VSKLTVVEPEELTYSVQKITPIPYLKIVDGYQCRYHGCDTVYGSVDMIKKHCRVEHLWTAAKEGVRWSETRAQSFYQSIHQRFIIVQFG
jgi:Orsellinic acid/F9775 biosynthesis cluster protein D